MPNYKNGKIYKLCNKINDKFYIGSTCTTVANRKSKYLTDVKKWPNSKLSREILKIGWKNENKEHVWFMTVLENFNCNSKKELEKREGYYQKLYFGSHPDKILNSRIEGDDKKTIHSRASAKYKENNPEKVKEAVRKCRIENKDKYNARKREKIECDICKAKISRNAMKEHQKSTKCQNIAVEFGFLAIQDVKSREKKMYKTKKEKALYDKQRYLEKKDHHRRTKSQKEINYEAKKNPRKYGNCQWTLERKTRGGKNKGDYCENSCSTKLFEGKLICGMHRRVIRNRKKKTSVLER